MMIHGDIERAAARMSRLAGVVAAFPQGRRLRVLFDPAAGAKISQVAASLGARAEVTHKRLEDAAFVITRNAAAREVRPHEARP
jgi:hypothetical protein